MADKDASELCLILIDPNFAGGPLANDLFMAWDPEIIKGEVTNPIDPQPGCRFSKRCPFCTEKCTSENIPLKEISPKHSVACVMAQ